MEYIAKFQDLLKELFQFDSSDLDFGIYRILNHKRKEIEDFIQKRLPNIVEEAFRKHKSSITENIDEEFEKVKQDVIKNFGKKAITSTGDIEDRFKNTPLGERYLEIKARKEEAEKIDEIKLQVFNDLYKFFSRYYEEGDFVPQYRYSIKEHKYAIPYNGEEVKLYWANAEQYYIKTGILFQDYAFRVGEYRIVFKTETAEEELSTNKQNEKQKRFILSDRGLEIDDNKKEVVIYFSYKLLSDKEIKNLKEKIKNGNGNDKNGENGNEEDKKEQIPKQEKINEVIFEEIKGILQNKKQPYLLKKLIENTKNEKPVLLYHINRFTAKNTRDFFIHKNLKRFLQEQLDYFIKAEVLDIKTLEEEQYLDKHITRAKTVREIGEKIIDFLSQIEDFQKRLWEKKKFVIKTDYVITLDRIKHWTDERFLDEVIEVVLENKRQLKEWEELGFGKIEKKEDLIDKKLPIDTRYFDEEFKFKLLEKISERFDLDEILDGILIKSENWQALNLLLNKYRERVKSIYIDPPYNTGSDEFLYRDRYQHSSWLTMMENRLSLARELMKDDGVIFVSIDDNELERLKIIMSLVYGEDKFLETFIWNNTSTPPSLSNISRKNVEYILTFTKQGITRKFKGRIAKGNDAPLLNTGNPMILLTFPHETVKFSIADGIYSKGKKKRVILLDDVVVENGLNKNAFRVQCESKWTQETLEEEIKKGTIFLVKSEDFSIRYLRTSEEIEWITPDKYIDNVFLEKKAGVGTNEDAKKELNNLSIDFPSYPKPVSLIHYLIRMISGSDDVVLDFFAGSGTTAHAVMKLNKEDGGKRKFILIEIADYFYTVIIPRIKKVAYSFNWKDGKPQDTDGIGVFFKYHTLEQYEDALDNIELKENKKAKELFKDEYLLKYFLDFETIDSEYLLNIEKLKNPFAYKLKINEGAEPKEVVVDIPETFNYLLGLKVKKIKVRYNEGKKYLFILGEKEGRDYAIIWREYQDGWTEEDFKKDKEFIKQELKEWKPQVIYISGQSILTQNFDDFQAEIRYIEPEFKRLMEKWWWKNHWR